LLEEGSLLANRPRPSGVYTGEEEESPENAGTLPAAATAAENPAAPQIPALEEEEEEELFVKFTHGKMIELAPLKGLFEEEEIPLADIGGEDESSEEELCENLYDDEYDIESDETGEEAYAELEDGIETGFGEEPEAAEEATGETAYHAKPAETKPASEGKPATSPRIKKNKWKKYHVPVEGILSEYAGVKYWEIDWETRQSGDLLKATLEEFKIKAEVVGIRKGPVITMFEILPEPGVKLSKISNLADNIALRLAASSVRIVAPIPGKHAVGIEIPNKNRAIVSFAELINAEKFVTKKMEIPLAIGKDITGEAQIIDLVDTPHLLIAGTTGS
jgi:S-DNA-T family DNA segregation ATPase FtsK/SpoIIIE